MQSNRILMVEDDKATMRVVLDMHDMHDYAPQPA